jgi:Uncharacterized protein conserved in bacteria (DUF2147)
MKKITFLFLMLPFCSFKKSNNNTADAIIGKWMNAEDNNLEVEIYKSGNEYKAKVVWFDDSDDKSRPMAQRCDTKNPDKTLRSRKLSAWK